MNFLSTSVIVNRYWLNRDYVYHTVIKPGATMIKKMKLTGEGYYSQGDNISFQNLTVEEEKTLFLEWQKGENYESRDKIIKHHLLFVACEAVKCAPSWLEKDEAISAGNAALMRAIDKFDCTRGFRFSVYLKKFIRGEVISLCRGKNPVRFPEGRKTEPAATLDNLDPELITPDYETQVEPIAGDEEHRELQLRKLKQALQRSWISPIERHVALEHNFEGKDYQTIATEMPKSLSARTVTRQRIGQIHKRVCAKLRTLMEQYGVDGL